VPVTFEILLALEVALKECELLNDLVGSKNKKPRTHKEFEVLLWIEID